MTKSTKIINHHKLINFIYDKLNSDSGIIWPAEKKTVKQEIMNILNEYREKSNNCDLVLKIIYAYQHLFSYPEFKEIYNEIVSSLDGEMNENILSEKEDINLPVNKLVEICCFEDAKEGAPHLSLSLLECEYLNNKSVFRCPDHPESFLTRVGEN
jgi:hypothetical protein